MTLLCSASSFSLYLYFLLNTTQLEFGVTSESTVSLFGFITSVILCKNIVYQNVVTKNCKRKNITKDKEHIRMERKSYDFFWIAFHIFNGIKVFWTFSLLMTLNIKFRYFNINIFWYNHSSFDFIPIITLSDKSWQIYKEIVNCSFQNKTTEEHRNTLITVLLISNTIVQQIVFHLQGFATNEIAVQIIRCVGSHRFQLSQCSTTCNRQICQTNKEATSSIQHDMTIG